MQKELAVEQQAKSVLAAANQEAERKIRIANQRLGVGSAALVIFLGLAAVFGVMASRAGYRAVIAQEEKQSADRARQTAEKEIDAATDRTHPRQYETRRYATAGCLIRKMIYKKPKPP